MLSRDKLDEIQWRDGLIVEKVEAEAKQIAANEISAIQRKSQILSNKIAELGRKKIEVLKSPRPKSEVLGVARRSLMENRRRLLFDELLVPFLKIVQEKRSDDLFFDPHIRFPVDLLRVAFCIFTEEDIKKAVEALPDNGLSESEIEAEIKKIDKEMAALASRVKEEVKI